MTYYYGNVETNRSQPLLNRLLGALRGYQKPLVVAVAGVGFLWILDKVTNEIARKIKSNRSKGSNEGLITAISTVERAVEQPYELTVAEPLETVEATVEEPYTDEDVEREILRRAMSELGKRSAEARRLRKLNGE